MARTSSSSLPEAHVLAGVGVHPVRLRELLAWIRQVIEARQRAIVMYANAYAVNLAQDDPEFKAAINDADLVFCDGYGVQIAARLLGTSLPERFTPPDWIDQLAGICAADGRRLFLLGAEPGVAATAGERLRERYPALKVSAHHGFFPLEGEGHDEILRVIEEAQPDILLVGMGMPRQEIWMQENRARLSVPVMISVGALFDYLAGRLTRGPRWLTDNGWEWLCRLWFEPRRLWRRYLLGNPTFMLRILQQRLRPAALSALGRPANEPGKPNSK